MMIHERNIMTSKSQKILFDIYRHSKKGKLFLLHNINVVKSDCKSLSSSSNCILQYNCVSLANNSTAYINKTIKVK